MAKNKGVLIVISGPSGAGKGTICKALLEKHKDIHLSVSATTRNPRQGEVHGINYYFLNKDEFLKKVEEDDFLEWAEVYGNCYGTPKSNVQELLDSGKDVILEIDIQGALKVKENTEEGVFIFILPPSMEELKPIKRIIQEARDRGMLIDATYGRRTRAVIITDSDHVILSAVQPETVAHRLSTKDEVEDEVED